MSGLHREVSLMLLAREHGPGAVDPLSGWAVGVGPGWFGTPNQRRSIQAANAWACVHLWRREEPAAATRTDAMAARLADAYRRERVRQGLCQGEALDGYSTQHCAGALGQLEAVRELSEYHPSEPVLRLMGEIVTWWRSVDTFVSALTGEDGVAHPPGTRVKSGGPRHRNVRGVDMLSYARGRMKHPYVIQRMREPLESEWWRELRPNEHALRGLLEGPAGELLLSILGPQVWPRLSWPMYWRSYPSGALNHVICPWLTGNGDGGDAGYNPRWEVQLDTGGEILRQVSARGVRGVKGDDTPLHPERSQREIRELVDGWRYLGPDSPVPEPVPWSGDGVAGGGNGEGEEVAKRTIIPRWKIKSWLKSGLPDHVRVGVPEILWQAQRLRDGEPKARERLDRAVNELREEEAP